jgi:hypothetical protein
MRYWLVTFRLYWTKTLFANVQFIHKSTVKPSVSVAKERAVHYWKYNWQLHHKNAAYLSIPDRFVVVSETKSSNQALPLPIPQGKFHPNTSNTQNGNRPASYA